MIMFQLRRRWTLRWKRKMLWLLFCSRCVVMQDAEQSEGQSLAQDTIKNLIANLGEQWEGENTS